MCIYSQFVIISQYNNEPIFKKLCFRSNFNLSGELNKLN